MLSLKFNYSYILVDIPSTPHVSSNARYISHPVLWIFSLPRLQKSTYNLIELQNYNILILWQIYSGTLHCFLADTPKLQTPELCRHFDMSRWFGLFWYWKLSPEMWTLIYIARTAPDVPAYTAPCKTHLIIQTFSICQNNGHSLYCKLHENLKMLNLYLLTKVVKRVWHFVSIPCTSIESFLWAFWFSPVAVSL